MSRQPKPHALTSAETPTEEPADVKKATDTVEPSEAPMVETADVVEAEVPAEPPKPKRYRVWSHGELVRNGVTYAPNAPTPFTEEQREAFGLQDILVPY